jgi:hypothetical protein
MYVHQRKTENTKHVRGRVESIHIVDHYSGLPLKLPERSVNLLEILLKDDVSEKLQVKELTIKSWVSTKVFN